MSKHEESMAPKISSSIQAGRAIIEEAAEDLQMDSGNLVLTGGTIARLIHDLPAGLDYDFVCRRPADPGAREVDESPRSWTWTKAVPARQVLRNWSGEPPYNFDLDHCRAFITMEEFFIPPSTLRKQLILLPCNFIDPVCTLARVVKWSKLGFTIPYGDLAPLVKAIRETTPVLNSDVESLQKGS
jgi:hypothetical protein